jgi:hypothetical protein
MVVYTAIQTSSRAIQEALSSLRRGEVDVEPGGDDKHGEEQEPAHDLAGEAGE